MATNIEQIFRSFVVNKFKEIQEEGKLTSENSENSQNGELTAQKEEETTSESTAVCLQSEGTAPTCQDETMKTENLELAKPVTIALETDSASKELKSAELTSDDEVKRDSSKKKSKKHKKHKSKKKKKKKKKEKHEKRSKSVSSVEDQENVSSETKSVWKPAFSSPPKEQGILDALSNAETTNTVVLSLVNTQSISSAIEDKPVGLPLDVDSGFFGPKCPNELGKNVSSNSVTCDVEIKEQCEASVVVVQQSSESTSHVEKVSEIGKTQQSGLSLPIYSQTKSPGVNSPIDVNSEKDSLLSLSRSQSQSNCEKLQISKEKSRSNSRHRSRSSSLVKVQKCLETSKKSPKSLPRSYSISSDQRKQSRSSSRGPTRRSTSRSSARRQRSSSRDSAQYSKSLITNWWSKSIRDRRRSVSVVKKPWSTKSPAQGHKSRSKSTEKRRCSRTRSRSPSRQRKSRSISRKYRQRSKSANKRTRSKSVNRRQSKSGSVSRIRRSRSVSGSRKRNSKSGSISRRRRSWSGLAARRQRSRSTSAVRRRKSRSVSLARRRRSRSASPGKRRSRSASPVRRRRSRSASPARRRRSRLASPARRRRSRSFSPIGKRRSRSLSPARRRRSRSVSPARRRRSRSVSPARRRRSRSVSPARRRRSRSVSPARRRRSRSVSPARRRRSRSVSPARRRRSRSASPTRTRKSRSASHNRRQSYSSVSRRRKSLERLQRLSSGSVLKRQRSRSSSNTRRQITRSTSAARKGSRSTSPSTTRRPSQSNTENHSRSPSGSVILKHKSRSVERKHKSRSRSTSKIRIIGLAPLNESHFSISSTVKQTNKPASSSETISDENKLPQMTSESLFKAGTIYLDKTDTQIESSENVPETNSCVLSNEKLFDSSFKASASNLPCSLFESNSEQNPHSDKSAKEMLASTNISVEPYKPFDQTSLDCTETNEKLQSLPGDAGVFNDSLFHSSQRVSARLAEEPCDKIQKPDIVSVVEHELDNNGSEMAKTCTTKPKDSPDVYKSTICDQYSMEDELPLSNQALPSDYSSLEAEGKGSFLDVANSQDSGSIASNPLPAETVQCSDWKQLACSNQMSIDDFKRHDSVTLPSTSTVSCMEPSTEYSRTLTVQDTSASRSDEHDIELNLIHDPLHHASLTSYIASDAGVKPNPFLAANITSLQSSLNNLSEIHIRTLKGEVSESYSQVDTNSSCHLKPENAPTLEFDLSSRDKVVLQNSAAASHTAPFTEQSHSIMSQQTYSEQTNKDVAYGTTAESFSIENDFASQGLINENLTSIYDKADLLVSTEREHPSETEGHYINNPEVDLTETRISQADLGDEPQLSPQKTLSPHRFPYSEDQTNRIFHKSRQSGPHGSASLTDSALSSKQVLEPVEQGGLDQSLYSSSENIECMSATSNQYAVSSTADLGKEFSDKSQNCNEIPESIKIKKSCPINSETHVDDGNKVDFVSASEDAEQNTNSVCLKDLARAVSDKEQNLRCEAEQQSNVPDIKMCPETPKMLIPMEMPSQKQQMYIQLTDTLSKTTVEPTDGDSNLPNVQYSFLLDNNQNLDNIAHSTNTNEDCKVHGPDMFLFRDSKEGKTVAEKPFGLDIEAGNHSPKKSASSYTALNFASLPASQNSGLEMRVKPVTEEGNIKLVSKLIEKDNLKVDVETKVKHGQVEYTSYTDSEYVCSNTTEAQKISTSVHEMQKPAAAMPLQFKFSKTFKTLASSQLCNTSDESSDKETSKVSSSSLSTKTSVSLYVDSSSTNAKSPQHVLHQKQLDTLLPEPLQPESLSIVGSEGKDVLQQDIQTDDSQSSAVIKPAFPHITNPLSKLGVKQRQYRSRSVAQDSRSPSVERQRGSRSRSKSTTRKRRSRSKSVSRKKRSQSSSRKKGSHSKSSKNKRSRSKSRGRKRRSQSKSKSKKKHSPSKSSGKRKRSHSKSSERVRSVGKPESSRSKSKTRRKGVHTKSPSGSRRSRSKSACRKSSHTKNSDVKKTSRSKSGSSRSRSRSISVSKRHLSHSKASLHRKHSRSSSKSTSPNKRSLSRNKGRSVSRSPARRHRSRSRSHTRRHRSRSRGRWRRSLSSSRKHSRSSSRTSGTLSAKKRRSVSKSPMRGRRSRSQAKLKDKSPVTKRKSISPIPQKKSTQSKAAAFKHSIGLKSLIQKQLSQAKSQGSSGKLSKEQIPLSTITARAQLPAANFSTRAQVSAPSLNASQISVPNLAEVPLPSEHGNGQIPVPSAPPEQQMSVTSLAPEAPLPVPDLTTATPWHVPDMASGAQWPVPDIAAGTQWSMSDLTAGAQWPMADLAAGSHWPMHDLSVGTQWSVPDLAAGTPWAVPDVATGAQWTVPDLTASTQWTVPDLTAGSQWAMTNFAPGAQWSVPDLAAAAQWTVPDLTSGTHIQSADLATEAQVPGSDLATEAQVPGSDLATEAQVPGSDLTAEARVPRSDLVNEAQVPVPDHIPDTSDDDLVSEGHNLMPDVTAEALVPVASGTLVPDVAAGIPLPDVTAATPTPVPDVAATVNMPVPDVATTAHSLMPGYASYSAVHESVFEDSAKQSVYLDISLTAGELVDSSCAPESLVYTKKLPSEALNRTEHQMALESLPSTDQCPPTELPLSHATVPEMSESFSQEEISVSPESQLESEHCSISNTSLFDPCLKSDNTSLIEYTLDQGSSGTSTQFASCTNSDCQLLPASDIDGTKENDLHADAIPSLLQECCPSQVQSYRSPYLATLVDPYHSPDNNVMEPYSSPEHAILVTQYSDSDCHVLTEPDAVSDCSVLAASCASSDHSPIVKTGSSHDHFCEEITEHRVNLDQLQKPEPCTTLPCPEPADCFAKPNFTEQANPYVSPSCRISGNKSAEPETPHLVEPYGSPEHPQLVELYASPEHPQLVEPYASPEHPLLVEPYGSPDSQELVESIASQELAQGAEIFAISESPQIVQSCMSSQSPQPNQPFDSTDHPQLDQPVNPDPIQLVQPNFSPKSPSSPKSPQAIHSCASLEGPQLVQPYADSEHKLEQPFADPEPILLEPFTKPEHLHVETIIVPESQQVVQPYGSPEHPQLVQPYDSPEHPQLVQPYDSPEHPQLVQPYDSPEHPQLVQPYDSPEHPQLVQPYDSPEHPQLVQPYDSPEHPQLVQPYDGPEPPQLVQPYDGPEPPQLVQPYDGPEPPQLVQPYDSPEHPQLVQPYDSPEHPQLVQPYDSPEHPQLVQPYDSPEHPQLVQPYDSPEHPQLVQPYDGPEPPQLVQPYDGPEPPQLVQPYDGPEPPQLVQPYDGPEPPQLVQPYDGPEPPQLVQPYDGPEPPQLVQPYDGPEPPQLVQPYDGPEPPQLVQPYDSPEPPQLVQPYDSPEHPQLVQPYDSPEHPQLVQPYDSPEHPQLVQPSGSPEHPQLVQPSGSPEHPQLVQPSGSPEHPQLVQPSGSPEHPQLVQPYDSPEHPQLVQPYDSPEHPQLVQPYDSPEHPQRVQPHDSPEHPQRVQPYDDGGPEHPQLVQPYDGPEHPQLVQPYEGPEHPQLVQPYDGPAHQQKDQVCDSPQLVLPFDSMECAHLVQPHAITACSELDQPYTSPKHLQVDQPHAGSEHLQLDEPYIGPKHLQAEQPRASLKDKQLARSYTSPEHPQLVQPIDSQDHPQLIQPYESSEHLQSCSAPVQTCASAEHPQLVESYTSPEHSQLIEPYSSIAPPQLIETYSSHNHSQCDETNSSPHLSPDHGLSCHDDIDKNRKLMQSPLSDSKFDNSLPENIEANTTGPFLDVPCSSLLQKHKTSPKLSKPILEDCSENSYKISSEELYNAADKSLLGDSSESSVPLVSKEDYIDSSDQYLTGDCHSSDTTQLDRSTSSIHHLELDHSSPFHQSQLEKSLSGKRQPQLGIQYTRDDQQPEKKLDPEKHCADSDQPQFSEHNNSEAYSSPISCLNKECFSTNQELSIDDMNVSGQPLDEQNGSSADQSMNDTCSDVQQINPISTNPEMPFLDRATSAVYLTDGTISSIDAHFEDSVVPSVEQKEQSYTSEEDKNLDATEQLLTDKSTELFKCDPPDSLTDQTEALSDQAASSPDSLLQNEPLEMCSYEHAENISHRHNQSPQEHPLVRASKRTSWDTSELTGLDKDYSKNEQVLSNPEICDISELDQTVEGSTSTRSEPLSPVQICSKPFSAILSAEPEEPSTSLGLQIQDKADSFMSIHVTTLSTEIDTHVAEDSGDNVQLDNECKITPPDLLPFDSEQPTPIYTQNSESSSEPVLFISQPPPELLPYDSEQPANPFQSISDYSSEQDSSVFHTPPELLPYDSDQTIVHVSKPESCEGKLSLSNATDESSATFAASENSFVSQLSVPSVDQETIEVQLCSAEEKDTSITSTKELDCVEYEMSRSSILTHASALNNPEMVVEQPATTILDVEFGQELPSSLSSCDETKCMPEQPVLHEITTPHALSQGEHSVEHSQLITKDFDHLLLTEDSIKSSPPVSKAETEQVSLILNTCGTLVVQSCSDNSNMVNFCEEEKLSVTQSPIVIEVSNKRSHSKSLLKTELSNSLSTSTKRDSPSKHTSRSARSHSRSKDRRKSRSKSTTRKKRSRSKSMTRAKKSRSKSVVKTRKSRSKSATRRKKSSSVSDTRFRKSRSRSKSRKRRSRSTSVANKRSSRSPSVAHRRRSRSSRRKRSHSTSVDPKRSHSNSVARRRRSRSLSLARRRYSRSRSPVRRRSRSSSVHRKKRSRSTSVARRKRSRSSSITRRRRSRSSSVSRRRPSPSQSVARRRRSPSLGRRRRSRSPSLAHRRRSRSASHRRRSRSPSASRRRRSPSAPRRRRSRSPSPPRRKRSSSAARKRRSHSTSVTRKRHSRSLSASRKRRSRSSSHKRHSQTPSIACKRRSESKSPTPKSPKIKQRAQSKSDRSRSRSQSNVIRKRKTRSRSSSRDISKSNEKRRKRSSSKEHYSIKQRRKSRTPPRRKKSRSPARRISPCRSPVRRRRSRSPVRRKSFSRSPVRRKQSRSRDQSMDCVRSPKRLTDLDKAQLLEIAKANAAAMCVKAGMPLPASLKPVLAPSAPVDEKSTHRTYGVTIQELTEKCKQIAQSKEDDEVVNRPHDSDEEEGDQPFYNHPFKVSEHKPISFSLLNPSLKPAPKTQVTLTKEFPVSSGSQHRKKEDKVYGEWVPVDKKSEEIKDDVFTNTGPSQPVDITAAMNERAMAQTRLTGNPFDLEALLMLNRAQEQIDAWAQSTSLPGQFTGSTGAQVLSADEISNTGPQAWLKKFWFPISSDSGVLTVRF
ncbi:protein SON isoform X4 [Rana temporaria]|uniref:protein SON isoform X4 n=1 Tax=Rana temporaria TaxID=8407 RepID=UPI001AAD2A57|nr:protein SON isoform X4 [Rana temporaria]